MVAHFQYTTYRSQAGPFFLPPPHQRSELPQAANSFKGGRESRTLRSAVPSAVVLLVAVFVVFGPSDLGFCLTRALHYSVRKKCEVYYVAGIVICFRCRNNDFARMCFARHGNIERESAATPCASWRGAAPSRRRGARTHGASCT